MLLQGSKTWVTGHFTKENVRNASLKGGGASQAGRKASSLAELDFYRIIEINIFTYVFLKFVITGQYVFCD